MHTHARTHARTHTHTRTHAHKHTRTHTRTPTHTHTHTHTHTDTHKQTNKHTHRHIDTPTHRHTRLRTTHLHLYYFHSTLTVLLVPKTTAFFAECVGTFKETRNTGFAGEFYSTSDEDTLADCQQSCVFSSPYCYAVDYKAGKCGMIYKEDEYKLIDNVGNVHSVMKPCNTRWDVQKQHHTNTHVAVRLPVHGVLGFVLVDVFFNEYYINDDNVTHLICHLL